MDLVSGILDKAIVDRNGRELGRVDGIDLELSDNAPPRVAALLVGPSVLGHRLAPALGKCVEGLEIAVGIERVPTTIEFKRVLANEREIKIDGAIGDTAAGVVEQKLRRWIVALTGSK